VVRKPAAPAPIDPATLAREIAVETGKAIAQEFRKEKPEPVVAADLDDKEKRDVAVLAELEAANPKNAGIAKAAENFFKKVLAPYRAAWQEKNPGKKFDTDAEEHEAIYAQQPEIDPEEFEAATKAFEQKDKERQVEARLEARIKEHEKKNIAREIQPKIENVATSEVVQLIKATEPEYEKILAENKPWQEMWDKMAADDPIAADLIGKSSRLVAAAAGEFEKLMTPELEYAFDPVKNAVHADIARHIGDYEQRLMSLPAADRVFQGKEFTTLEKFNEMTGSERAKHWIVEWNDIRADYFPSFAAQVKLAMTKEREKAAKTAERMGYVKPESASKPTPKQKATPVETPAAKSKPKPPSTSASTDNLTAGAAPSGGSKTFADQVVESLFGG